MAHPGQITQRDKDFGAVRLADTRRFHTEVSGTCETYKVTDLDGQLRGVLLQHLSDAVAQSGILFLDLAATRSKSSRLCRPPLPAFEALGLHLESLTAQNVSLPKELQVDEVVNMGQHAMHVSLVKDRV